MLNNVAGATTDNHLNTAQAERQRSAIIPVASILTPAIEADNNQKWTRISPSLRRRRPFYQKLVGRIGDVIGGIALAVIFLPIMVPIVLILLLSGHGVIYSQKRIGLDGRVFKCFKFRTMIPNAEAVLHELLAKDPEARKEWKRDHKLKDDPRITAVGKFLRRTSLDELPQVLNVLKGEMSLIGPRPVVREELLRYGRWLPAYLTARPGITGLWQVSGRNNMSYHRRVAIDIYYSRHRSIWLNTYILAKTMSVVMKRDGAY